MFFDPGFNPFVFVYAVIIHSFEVDARLVPSNLCFFVEVRVKINVNIFFVIDLLSRSNKIHPNRKPAMTSPQSATSAPTTAYKYITGKVSSC